MNKLTVLILTLLKLNCLTGLSQVNFEKSIQIQGLRLYQDIKKEGTYYYVSTAIEVAKDREGNPEFRMVMMRYTGRRLSQDQQKKMFKNIAQFRVVIKSPSPETLNVIKAQLGNVELKSIPLNHTESFLIYTPIVPNEKELVLNGVSEEISNLSDERIFTIMMSNEDAQLLEKAFQKGQTLISVGYAFFVEGIVAERPFMETEIQNKLNSKFNNFLIGFADSLRQKNSTKIVLVGAGATEVLLPVDYAKFVKKVDINEQLPAEYAAIDVRCYDFNNELRTDLYAKKVEIEAISIDGTPITIQATFYRRFPEVYIKHLKFNYAVKVDTPLRFRIIEINDSGNTFIKGWVIRNEWGQIDITSK